MILHLARRHHEALEKAQNAIALDSAYMFAYDRLHWAYYGEGRHQEGLVAAKRAVALSGDKDLRRRGFLAHAYALAGDSAAAHAILNELLEVQRDTYVPPTAIAAVYVGLGNTAQALRWLERGFAGRDGDMVLLKTLSLWDPLRAEPRFAALIEQMRFTKPIPR
jgi:tetratricopeptide (TPR) repeat protein